MHSLRRYAALLVLALGATGARAAVLAEDRADMMYHRYQGGGITVDGPSVLVRKKFAENFSVQAGYTVDTVSGASIDVLSNASTIHDKRKQKNIGVDYIRGKTSYSLGYTNSKETDYISDTWHASLSQDMFGDLTTVSIGFRRGMNDVYMIKDGAKKYALRVWRKTWRAILTAPRVLRGLATRSSACSRSARWT